MNNAVTVQIEKMSIPTYPIMECEKMPMFNENRMHQGTKGNPYPVMPVLSVVRENCAPREYEVIRMENDYLRLILIPELGGRVFEAYDKVNHYDFLYRQHVIKPALIGAYGLWISGGLEFNWPFHHRPSTYMPVNYSIERQADGTAITWLSECDPTDRTRATIGIVLRSDAAFFETRIHVVNRTPLRHSFLMWQNAAVPVNDDYQFVFPPDVSYVNNHYSLGRPPMTYPIAQGAYSSAYYDEPVDISWYKNCYHATSHFAAPSKYDFFGGYDHGRQCGVIHVANHHVSPGKKMFTWGLGPLSEQWEKALTDEDGLYCELMAGSYSNNQPDFTWLNPYETKCFSEYWYPVGALGKSSFATLEAAVNVDLGAGKLRVQTTKARSSVCAVLKVNGQTVLNKAFDAVPGQPVVLSFTPTEGKYEIELIAQDEAVLLHYTQENNDLVHYPEPLSIYPHPDTINSVQDLYLQGVHTDQYRNPQNEPSIYYEEALRRDPDHIPSLIALGEYKYRRGFLKEAKALLERAIQREHIYNQRYQDGEAEYLLGLTLDALNETDKAYDVLYSAAWSGQTVSKAMSKLAAIDGRRGDYLMMLEHATTALEAAARHPLAASYAALANARLGRNDEAVCLIKTALAYDPLDDLAGYVRVLLENDDIAAFVASRRSDFSQTALDIAFDLHDAGFDGEAIHLLSAIDAPTTPMVFYTLADLLEKRGENTEAARACAMNCMPQNTFPYRLDEIRVLEHAIGNEQDDRARDLLACVLYDKGHYARAASLWSEALALKPDCALYHRNLAVALFSHMKRRDEAMEHLLQAMELEPANDQLKLEYLYAATKCGLAGEERLRVIAGHPLAGKASDDYVLEHAKAFCIAGRYDDALKVMLSHSFVPAEGGEMAISGLYFSIMLHKGREQMRLGNYEEALQIFENALLLPENLHSGLWAETDQVPLYYYQAIALEKLGRIEESKKRYALVLKRITTAKPELPFYYGSAMRAMGRDVEGRIFISRTVRALEEKASHLSVGWEDITAAFNPFVNDPQEQREGMCAYWRGMIKKYEGDMAGAHALFEKSRRLWPENLNTWIEMDF